MHRRSIVAFDERAVCNWWSDFIEVCTEGVILWRDLRRPFWAFRSCRLRGIWKFWTHTAIPVSWDSFTDPKMWSIQSASPVDVLVPHFLLSPNLLYRDTWVRWGIFLGSFTRITYRSFEIFKFCSRKYKSSSPRAEKSFIEQKPRFGWLSHINLVYNSDYASPITLLLSVFSTAW